MALKNLKEYVPPIKAHNTGIVDLDQIQLETKTLPSDGDLAVGRIYCDGSTIYGYNGSNFVDMLSSGTINIAAWETLYAADTNLNMAGASLTFAGTHASNDTFVLTADGTGDCLKLTQSSTGYDISANTDSWTIKSSGSTGILELGSTGSINVADGALTIGLSGTATTLAGTLTVDETVILTGAVTATASITITGSADSDVFVITDGDVLIDDGHLSITESDSATPVINIASSATGGNPIEITANALTTGAAFYVTSSNEGNFASDGGYLNLTLSGTSVFKIQRYGATTIAGAAGTGVLNITAGDVVLSEGSVTLTDDDNAASLSVTNDGADTVGNASSDAGCVDMIFSALTTGQGLYIRADAITEGSALSIDNGGNSLTSGYYIECGDDGVATFTVGDDGATIITSILAGTTSFVISNDAATTVDVFTMSVDALTSGDALFIDQAGEDLTSGELLKIVNTESGTLAAQSGNLCSITSSLEETGATRTESYDMLLLSRTDINNKSAATYTAQGSVLQVLHTATQTQATLADTVCTLEVIKAGAAGAAATGDLVRFTGVATGGETLNIISACTTVSDVLITSSGAKANNKAALEVTTSGATAAGGAVLRVTHSGDPAAATGYLADFDSTGGSTSNNAIGVIIQHEGTGAPLKITTSGAAANGILHLESTEAGTTGVILKLDHQGGSQADADVIGRIQFSGEDDAGTPADNNYARIDVVAADSAAASEDGDMIFYVCRAGTETQQLKLDSDINGIIVGDDSAAAIITSAGADDLELTTGDNGASEPTIVLTDGSNGDITITPSGTGLTNIIGSAPTVTAKTTTATLTEAEGGIITVTTASGWTATLPAVSGNSGLWYTFKKTDSASNALTIDADGSELIDGSETNTEVDAQYDTLTIVCNGSAWFIIAKEIAA